MRTAWTRAIAALLAVRLSGDRLFFIAQELLVLFIAVYLAAGQHVRKAIKRRSGVGQVAHATAIRRCGSCLHSVYQPIECQLSTFPSKVGASCQTV